VLLDARDVHTEAQVDSLPAHLHGEEAAHVVVEAAQEELAAVELGRARAQAVEDALADTGLEILEMPLSPNRLFELLQEREAL
jgi:hypothetical protein